MPYRLYAVWLRASWQHAVLSVMLGLVRYAAAVLTQHRCATTQKEFVSELLVALLRCAAITP